MMNPKTFKYSMYFFISVLLILSCQRLSFAEPETLSESDTPSEEKVSTIKQFVLTQQQWAIPRNATSVISMPAINKAMKYLTVNNHASLVVLYAGGEEGILWASELKGWLISLGLSSSHIELQAGGLATDRLELKVIKNVK